LSAKASEAVEGAGIPTSTTVVSITSTTIVISQNANANNSSASSRICPWGNGDGSTTFNLPDRRYRTLVGRDNINNNPASRSSDFAGTHLSTAGGEEMHQLVTNEAPSGLLTLNFNDPGHTHSINGSTGVMSYTGGSGQYSSGGNHRDRQQHHRHHFVPQR